MSTPISTAQLPEELQLSTVIDRTIHSEQKLVRMISQNSTAVSTASPVPISVRLNTNDWWNPSQSYFKFGVTLTSTAGTTAFLKNGIGSLFKSVRVLIDGQSPTSGGRHRLPGKPGGGVVILA